MSAKLALCMLLVLLSVEALKRPILGGWKPMNRNCPEAQKAAGKAVEHLQERSYSRSIIRLYKLEKIASQIVNGKNYKMTLLIAKTNCIRGDNTVPECCIDKKLQRCNVTLYQPIGSEYSRLTYSRCDKEMNIIKKKRETPPMEEDEVITGGEMDIDASSVEVIDAATFATEELTNRSNGEYRVQLLCITDGFEQVVGGMLYHLNIVVSVIYSDNVVKRTRCVVDVWDHSWEEPPVTLLESKCDDFIAQVSNWD